MARVLADSGKGNVTPFRRADAGGNAALNVAYSFSRFIDRTGSLP
jgi:hypothetical protein